MLGHDHVTGFDLIAAIKKLDHNPPVIFLSARSSEIDRIIGLEKGGDDYVTKPFSPKELLLRINNQLEKSKLNSKVIHWHGHSFDLTNSTCFVRGIPIQFTKKEFNLIIYFILHPNQLVEKALIIETIWAGEKAPSNIEVAISNLLNRIKTKIGDFNVINSRNQGYTLVDA
jgi:two-component system response regulator CssR